MSYSSPSCSLCMGGSGKGLRIGCRPPTTPLLPKPSPTYPLNLLPTVPPRIFPLKLPPASSRCQSLGTYESEGDAKQACNGEGHGTTAFCGGC